MPFRWDYDHLTEAKTPDDARAAPAYKYGRDAVGETKKKKRSGGGGGGGSNINLGGSGEGILILIPILIVGLTLYGLWKGGSWIFKKSNKALKRRRQRRLERQAGARPLSLHQRDVPVKTAYLQHYESHLRGETTPEALEAKKQREEETARRMKAETALARLVLTDPLHVLPPQLAADSVDVVPIEGGSVVAFGLRWMGKLQNFGNSTGKEEPCDANVDLTAALFDARGLCVGVVDGGAVEGRLAADGAIEHTGDNRQGGNGPAAVPGQHPMLVERGNHEAVLCRLDRLPAHVTTVVVGVLLRDDFHNIDDAHIELVRGDPGGSSASASSASAADIVTPTPGAGNDSTTSLAPPTSASSQQWRVPRSPRSDSRRSRSPSPSPLPIAGGTHRASSAADLAAMVAPSAPPADDDGDAGTVPSVDESMLTWSADTTDSLVRYRLDVAECGKCAGYVMGKLVRGGPAGWYFVAIRQAEFVPSNDPKSLLVRLDEHARPNIRIDDPSTLEVHVVPRRAPPPLPQGWTQSMASTTGELVFERWAGGRVVEQSFDDPRGPPDALLLPDGEAPDVRVDVRSFDRLGFELGAHGVFSQPVRKVSGALVLNGGSSSSGNITGKGAVAERDDTDVAHHVLFEVFDSRMVQQQCSGVLDIEVRDTAIKALLLSARIDLSEVVPPPASPMAQAGGEPCGRIVVARLSRGVLARSPAHAMSMQENRGLRLFVGMEPAGFCLPPLNPTVLAVRIENFKMADHSEFGGILDLTWGAQKHRVKITAKQIRDGTQGGADKCVCWPLRGDWHTSPQISFRLNGRPGTGVATFDLERHPLPFEGVLPLSQDPNVPSSKWSDCSVVCAVRVLPPRLPET